jgi:hypothetical protein
MANNVILWGVMPEFTLVQDLFETMLQQGMKKAPKNTRPESAVSLAALTPDQALLAALRVTPCGPEGT